MGNKEIKVKNPFDIKLTNNLSKKKQKERLKPSVSVPKKMQFGGDPTGNTMSEADMKRMQELMGRTKAKETGNAISNSDAAMLKALLAGAGGSGIGKGMPQGKKMGGKVQKMNMGGQVMDTTKSMPVGMMDGGKVKKMNMGGVIPGRGGMFKGMK